MIEKAITRLAEQIHKDLYEKTEEELEYYWQFKFDAERSIEQNMYSFYRRLRAYESMCRRWEEHHNGSCCVVERVRDKYVMPKIREFADGVIRSSEKDRLMNG